MQKTEQQLLHEKFMHRCLQLAAMGQGNVAPNPMVGAVLVHNGKIISEGYHRQYGGKHAEVDCLDNVKKENKNLVAGSTLYVSLEPCDHVGKTPPCTNRIIQEGIKKVVVGTKDFSEKVNGKGLAKLKNAGVEVVNGVLESECIKLNKRFFISNRYSRPYIILKWAQSADGFISGKNMEQVPISNIYTNRLVHKWRSEEAGIMVGTNTVLYDDPQLNTRLWPGKDPVRIVPDRHKKLPTGLNVFNRKVSTIVLTECFQEQDQENLQFATFSSWELEVFLCYLHAKGIQSILVEGGKALINSFVEGGLWDEARKIVNTHLFLSSGVPAPVLHVHKLHHQEKILNDIISYFEPATI